MVQTRGDLHHLNKRARFRSVAARKEAKKYDRTESNEF